MSRLRARFFALVVFCVCTTWISADIEIPNEGAPGGFLAVKVTGSIAFNSLRVQLLDSHGRVASQNMLFSLPDRGKEEHYALLGVPESFEEGSYTVAVTGEDGSLIKSMVITVSPREFPSETIHLDGSLSALRRTDSARRLQEAHQLHELLSRSNTDALHHMGPFSPPVEGATVTSDFGHRRLFVYVDGDSGRSVHSGIDLAVPVGTPVTSSGKGIVVFAGDRLITGNTVVIEHLPGVFSLYYHLDRTAVKTGEYVSEESVIGTVGSTGLATGPHLHWEFRIGRVAVDPEIMIEFGF